jgi:hypothetical protein
MQKDHQNGKNGSKNRGELEKDGQARYAPMRTGSGNGAADSPFE